MGKLAPDEVDPGPVLIKSDVRREQRRCLQVNVENLDDAAGHCGSFFASKLT